jgi:aspartate racemase
MGTQATACLYGIIHDLQCVTVEQEYIDILLYSRPSIPDRTAYITGQSAESPLAALVSAAKTLENAGVDCIIIPCATSHFFYDELVKAVGIPILNLLDETAQYVKALGAKSVCLLATDGTVKSRLFHKAFEKLGIEVITPTDGVQADLMEMIYDIKRGDEVSPDALCDIASKACDGEVDAVVLGCTELCVVSEPRFEALDKGTVPIRATGSLSCRASLARLWTDEPSPCLVNILEVLAEASIAFYKTGNE